MGIYPYVPPKGWSDEGTENLVNRLFEFQFGKDVFVPIHISRGKFNRWYPNLVCSGIWIAPLVAAIQVIRKRAGKHLRSTSSLPCRVPSCGYRLGRFLPGYHPSVERYTAVKYVSDDHSGRG